MNDFEGMRSAMYLTDEKLFQGKQETSPKVTKKLKLQHEWKANKNYSICDKMNSQKHIK